MTDSVAAAILARARACGWIVTCAESCTGGMVAAGLTDLPGSSEIFERGYVTYSNRAKSEMLGVLPETLDAFGAVSEPVVAEMALGAARAANAQIAVAVSGIAGPGGSAFKPEGRVCFGLCVEGKTRTETVEFGAIGRGFVRQAAMEHALAMVLSALPE